MIQPDKSYLTSYRDKHPEDNYVPDDMLVQTLSYQCFCFSEACRNLGKAVLTLFTKK